MTELLPSLEQTPSPNAVIADFSEHIETKVSGLQELDEFFKDALPFVTDVEAVNDCLTEQGRPDLIITDKIDIMQITQPREIFDKCNNFPPNFSVYTKREETGELDWNNEPILQGVGVTAEELLGLQELPKLTSYDHLRTVKDSGKFPGLGFNSGHTSHAFFVRLLNLFPKFTTNLTVELSKIENVRGHKKFEQHLYVAYHLMSHLVDASDLYAVRDDGERDAWFLCR